MATRSEENLELKRYFTKKGVEPLDTIKYSKRNSEITNSDGSTVFRLENVEVPENWSQLATDIIVSKYFRRTGVKNPNGTIEGEHSARQVVYRISHTIREKGLEYGYFKNKIEADTFESELSHILINQIGAFNSPVWFNCGLHQIYGIEGSGTSYAWDFAEKIIFELENPYKRPQCSACFIQSVDDDLASIYDLVNQEARLFKYGSGTGTNFSRIRGHMEKLSGGGTSSGLMSFLKILDRSADAVKSGGTTRRAAKMVSLDIDHPEIEEFITWKLKEEKKVKALIDAGYPSDFNGEAYRTVSGQNSNNSVRISDEFMQAVINDDNWSTYERKTGKVFKTYKARELYKLIADSAWACADPGVQFDTIINNWHTCKNTDRIYASNPCSEYMFIDDSACNLASINLTKFLNENGEFNIEGFKHTCSILIIAQEIMVDYSSYPTAKIALNSHKFRPLGLGYANLGTMLMLLGIPYDSPAGAAWCSAITALMTGRAYEQSAYMAKKMGPFNEFENNREPFIDVMRMHQNAIDLIASDKVPSYLLDAAKEEWKSVIELGQKYGFRNAQTTVLAPTGTIGLLMDCDTTGIEPDFSLVKYKKLSGGGYFKIVNQSVPSALARLGYTPNQVDRTIKHIIGHLTLDQAPHINKVKLLEIGFTHPEINKLESQLESAFDLPSLFSSWNIASDTFERLGFSKEQYASSEFNLLKELGFSKNQIEEANDWVCGNLTIEGSPDLRPEHLPVFDCANRNGKKGQRFIHPLGHLRMMAAAQPFLSGAISKTVNLPNEFTAEEIGEVYLQAWKMGLKAVAIYRDGSKFSQPLSSSGASNSEKKASARDQELLQRIDELESELKTLRETRAGELHRRKLPSRRKGFTWEAKVNNQKIYLRTGEYDDGTLGELFIDMHKEGSTIRSMLNCFAIAISKGLQYGVPLEEFVETFIFTNFEPSGSVQGHPYVKRVKSILDYVFKVLGIQYLGRYDLANISEEEVIQHETSQVTPVISNTTPAVEQSTGFSIQQHPIAVEETSAVRQKNAQIAFSGMNNPKPTNGNGTTSSSHGTNRDLRSLMKHLGTMQSDAPLCDVCGNLTVRNGSCYKCLHCGNSQGCS